MPTKKQLNLMREVEFEYPETRRTDDPMYVKPVRKNYSYTVIPPQKKSRINYDYVAIVILLIAWVCYFSDWNANLPHEYSDAAWYFVSLVGLGVLIGLRREIVKIKTKFLKQKG